MVKFPAGAKVTDKKIALTHTRCVFIEDREVNNVFLNVSVVHKGGRRRDSLGC